jgi:roadblock/LC7 domain-containing protein
VSLIDSATGTTLARATTDVTGFYFFPTTGLLNTNGTYSVSVTGLPAGFSSSSPAQTFTWIGSPISLSNFTLT